MLRTDFHVTIYPLFNTENPINLTQTMKPQKEIDLTGHLSQ